mgnify:CR=1 FL=1
MSREEIEKLLKQGKMVVVVGKCDSRVRVDGPKDKVAVVVRE